MPLRSTLLLFLLSFVGPGHADSGNIVPNAMLPDGRLMVAKAGHASRCVGKERWTVKTGVDRDSGSVDLTHPTIATVDDLTQEAEPAHKPATTRISPIETTVFRVKATLLEYAMENDRDYHLVIRSGSSTMIAEIPDPVCVKASSPFKAKIINARAEFDGRFSPTSAFQKTSVPVTVTGVGFFDLKHAKKQHGVARNNIELHPVLDIQLDSK